ncbi:TolC family protein [Pseudodesulfovibrio indicus]|uniref:Outer membrane protein TolC n=1 Tax=Pseudodesulfovibrio indicus TaxID=1716143 RepID=A0A126QMX9_9BACT|nr:TolC family protein [Pseudodesulfovibrio indicus]AMK10795.1 sulfonate ABC transporter substrate-binding protein [Pseudodesulfovibrio indicus]TDT91782.1 outer membrane protein TolC [Pseudodesulfovibrio indicus]
MNRIFQTISLTAVMLIAMTGASGAASETETVAPETTVRDEAVPGSYLGDRAELADLKGYLGLAAENNNDLRAAFQQWQAAIKRAVRADTLPDPRLNFGYYTTPLETRGGPARYKYGLSQSLPFFGKLGAKERMALREADGFKAKFDALKLTTFLEVKKLYYEYAYLARAIEITGENIELMQYLEKIATARYTSGSAKHSDIIRPQVELGKLEDRLNSLKDLKRPLAARLNSLLDNPPDADIPFPASVPAMSITDSDDALVAMLDESNPQLAYWETVLAREEAGRDLAERDYYPDFTFGLDVTEVDKARNPGVMGDGDNPVMATMSFNVPLWFGAREAAVEESQAKIISAKRSHMGLQRKLRADLELALYKYRDAGRKIDLYRDTLVPKAEQSLGVVMEGFMTGTGTSLDLIDSEQTLLELKLAYYRALADQAQRLAEIETLVGVELPCEFHGSLLSKDQ